MTCLKCPWIQCFQGIIRFWLDFYKEKLMRILRMYAMTQPISSGMAAPTTVPMKLEKDGQ